MRDALARLIVLLRIGSEANAKREIDHLVAQIARSQDTNRLRQFRRVAEYAAAAARAIGA